MKPFKFLSVLLLFILLMESIPVFANVPTDENLANITINKRVFEDEIPDEVVNTGEKMDFAGKPLANAGFTIYDVTAVYHEAVKESTQQVVMDQLVADVAKLAIAENVVLATKEQKTNSLGQTTFTVPLKKEKQDAVYLIVETTLPSSPTIKEKALPIVLALPVSDLEGDQNRDIYVYPKNVSTETPVPTPNPTPKPTPSKTTKKKKWLPQTGEVKSMVGLLGVVLIGVATVFWKQRTKNKS